MQVAICDDDVTDRTKVGELLAQKMRKRGEPLEITYQCHLVKLQG